MSTCPQTRCASKAETSQETAAGPDCSEEYVRLLDLLARDHLTRARQLRRMAALCRPTLTPLETAMWRRAAECEFSGRGIELLADARRGTAKRARSLVG
jgi:hypothetical protein